MQAGFVFYLIPLRRCLLLRVLCSEARDIRQEHLCFRTGDNSCFVKPETAIQNHDWGRLVPAARTKSFF